MTHEFKRAVIATKGNTYVFEVGKDNVKSILRNGYSTEPHCGVEFVEVNYTDKSQRIFNLAYTPNIGLFAQTEKE